MGSINNIHIINILHPGCHHKEQQKATAAKGHTFSSFILGGCFIALHVEQLFFVGYVRNCILIRLGLAQKIGRNSNIIYDSAAVPQGRRGCNSIQPCLVANIKLWRRSRIIICCLVIPDPADFDTDPAWNFLITLVPCLWERPSNV